ncbi:MAG: hypothetical protein U9R17_14880 [Thermodesulfobacteriota bacterium]|nr:hypothetical protein [Thermodesulfobacteriota bacterium]
MDCSQILRKGTIRVKGDKRNLCDSDVVENVLSSAEEELEQTLLIDTQSQGL